MAQGTVKTIRADKGFGFIKRENAPIGTGDLFFHQSALVGASIYDLQEGQLVSFDEDRDPRDATRQRANNVRVENGASPVADEDDEI
jgi:CspA family cold shock protein